MEDFKEQIKNIKNSYETRNEDDYSDERYRNVALDELFHTAREAAHVMNEGNAGRFVRIFRIEDELVPLLFRLGDDCSGFVIATPVKFIFFVSGNRGTIYTYGLERNTGISSGNLLVNAVQLLTLEYKVKPANVIFKDTTGAPLDPEEVVFHLFKWGVS